MRLAFWRFTPPPAASVARRIRTSGSERKRESGFLSRAEAEIAVAKIRLAEKESRYGILRPFEYPTVEELATKHIERIENRRERVRARRVMDKWCRLLPRRLRVNEVLSAHLQLLIDRRRADGLLASSINREMNIVAAALHSAQLYFPALSNWNAPKIPRPAHSRRRRERVITSAEFLRVITWLYQPPREDETTEQAANRRNVGHVFRMTLLAGGARKGEICKIRRDHIDWGSMVLQLVGTKTEGRSARTTVRPVEITDSIAEILRERLAVIPKDQQYIFTRSGGEVTHYYKILRAACGATGVLYGRNVVGGLVTHDTRHTAATRMLQAGHDLATVGSVLGHTDRTMTMNYSHANRETVHKAMEAVEEFAGTGTLGKVSE